MMRLKKPKNSFGGTDSDLGVTGKAKPFSDLDLAVMGAEPLPSATLTALVDAFDESDLPFKVDIVDWAVTEDSFRGTIAEQATRL
jgi:hypothetical protein